MSDLYEYQAIDGSSKGPVSLVLLIQARNCGRLSNRTLARKLPGGSWQPLSSFIPSMTVMDDEREVSTAAENGSSSGTAAWSRKKYWGRVIKAWCSFQGRAGKGEMQEVYSSLGIVWVALAGLSFLAEFFRVPELSRWMELVSPFLSYAVLPVLSIPLAATMVRRLHDVGKSGVWLVWLGVPVAGWLLLWYLCYGESRIGENKYGDPPWN